MCDFCHMRFCPPRCPEYSGEKAGWGMPIGRCAVCESPIYKGESHFSNGRSALCSDCAEYLSIDEINCLCGFESEKELLRSLGFEEQSKV